MKNFLKLFHRSLPHSLGPYFSLKGLGILDFQPDSFKDYILKNNMPKKITALRSGLDKRSLDIVDNDIRKIVNLPDRRYAAYLYCQKNEFRKQFETAYEKQFEKCVATQENKIRRQWLLSQNHYDLEVFIYHHGLRHASNKIKNYVAHKDVVDAGAFIGDSALVFMKYKPNKIYSFEICSEFVDAYKKTMAMNKIPHEKYEIIKAALSDKGGWGTVANKDGMANNIYNSRGNRVRKFSLDSFLKNKKVNIGFIKADIEGSMYDALLGMKETIKKYRPILSLAIYHSPKEFFETKPLLEKIVKNLNYTIKVDCHFPSCFHIYGTILWAYPSELNN